VAKIAVVYYSAYGHTYEIAKQVEAGAQSAGAEVRLRKVRELAPEETIATHKGWHAHHVATQHVQEATLDDLAWADGFAFGSPTRFGNVAAQLKQFIDTTGPLWQKGQLSNKPVTAFTGAQNPHGGQETTITSFYNVFAHWGAIIVPIGYTDPSIFQAGGNPYGVSFTASDDGSFPEGVLAAARYQGERLTRIAQTLIGEREAFFSA
jgi:NAD(P)H dehydrogenase (quinone)